MVVQEASHVASSQPPLNAPPWKMHRQDITSHALASSPSRPFRLPCPGRGVLTGCLERPRRRREAAEGARRSELLRDAAKDGDGRGERKGRELHRFAWLVLPLLPLFLLTARPSFCFPLSPSLQLHFPPSFPRSLNLFSSLPPYRSPRLPPTAARLAPLSPRGPLPRQP